MSEQFRSKGWAPVSRSESDDFRGRHALAVMSLLLIASGLAGCDGTTDNGDQPDTRIAWTFQGGAAIYYGSPALSRDESTVYIGTSNALFGPFQNTHAIQAVAVNDGSLQWSYALGASEVRSTPAVAPDGSITVVVDEHNATGGLVRSLVHRLSASGAVRWSYELGLAPSRVDIGFSAPAIAADGTTYVASDALYAIRPDGTLKWKVLGPAPEDLRGSPVIGADGTVYFAAHNIPLTAFHPDSGRVLWRLPLGVNDHVVASPSIAVDGTLYVATSPGILYAVSSAGVLLWTFDVATVGYHCTFRSSPAVAADGTIYLGSNQGNPSSALFALRPSGQIRWIFEPSDLPSDVPSDHFDIYSSPAIGSDGALYFGQEFGRVYALDGASGVLKWLVNTETGITWSSPALTSAGTLLISDLDGRLYAITTESRGLQAGAPWPRYRHDNTSTGKAGG